MRCRGMLQYVIVYYCVGSTPHPCIRQKSNGKEHSRMQRKRCARKIVYDGLTGTGYHGKLPTYRRTLPCGLCLREVGGEEIGA